MKMGRPKRLYPHGKYGLCTPKLVELDKLYPLGLDYTWDHQVIRRTTYLLITEVDGIKNSDKDRRELSASYSPEYKSLNKMLQTRVEHLDPLLAKYNEKPSFQITAEIVTSILADKPMSRKDQGRDFVEFAIKRLASDYSRNRMGHSRYENGKSGMNLPRGFLHSLHQASHLPAGFHLCG